MTPLPSEWINNNAIYIIFYFLLSVMMLVSALFYAIKVVNVRFIRRTKYNSAKCTDNNKLNEKIFNTFFPIYLLFSKALGDSMLRREYILLHNNDMELIKSLNINSVHKKTYIGNYIHWATHYYFITGALLITLFKPYPEFFIKYQPYEVRYIQSAGFIILLISNILTDSISFLFTRYHLLLMITRSKIAPFRAIVVVSIREISVSLLCFITSQAVSNYFYSWHIGNQINYRYYMVNFIDTAMAPYVIYRNAADQSSEVVVAIPGQLIFSLTSLMPSFLIISILLSTFALSFFIIIIDKTSELFFNGNKSESSLALFFIAIKTAINRALIAAISKDTRKISTIYSRFIYWIIYLTRSDIISIVLCVKTFYNFIIFFSSFISLSIIYQ